MPLCCYREGDIHLHWGFSPNPVQFGAGGGGGGGGKGAVLLLYLLAPNWALQACELG